MKECETAVSNINSNKQDLYTYLDNTEFSDEIKEKIKAMLEIVKLKSDKDNDPDDFDIIPEYDDVKLILQEGDVAFVGSGESKSDNSVAEAIKLSIEDSSFNYNLMNVTSIFLYITMHPDIHMLHVVEATSVLEKNFPLVDNCCLGIEFPKTVSKNYVKAIILLTTFENKIVQTVQQPPKPKNGEYPAGYVRNESAIVNEVRNFNHVKDRLHQIRYIFYKGITDFGYTDGIAHERWSIKIKTGE